MHRSLVLLAVCLGAVVGCAPAQRVSPELPAAAAPSFALRDTRRAPRDATYRVVYAFRGRSEGDGANPIANLVVSGPVLYGTTPAGGASDKNGDGTVFEITAATGAERILHRFNGADGSQPFAGLTSMNGAFYGTTRIGGAKDRGTVFELDATQRVRRIYSFSGQSDGANPIGAMGTSSGMLYGTTYGGGNPSGGTLFRINPTNGAESVLHAFGGGSDGSKPRSGGLVSGGRVYGSTLAGGATGAGTVFAYTLSSGVAQVLYRFAGFPDGGNPVSGLVAMGDWFYGTTQSGGAKGFGTVYEVRASGAERIVYSFRNGTDGATPFGDLVALPNGELYGTTIGGGLGGGGTVFEVNPSTGAERVLHAFRAGSDGFRPVAGLVAVDNVLYGTTENGGEDGKCTHGCGVVFAVTL